ncbi:MAG: helix-hairpin-helix domain-containing protein [Kastovskya adunca ATA6-11-RM4]|jgi:DNA uptake protein ComE-like DNA-binding protein|nr:helix-hairpin-helix domain-containing protein [Kastovskya adunca ATA6-11-RM4]
MVNLKEEALKLLKEALDELEAPKGSVLSGIQKLLRVARIIGEENISKWCDIQLGKVDYASPFIDYIDALVASEESKGKKNEERITEGVNRLKRLEELGIKADDVTFLIDEAGGGLAGIDFIEEKYADLVRTKRNNDGQFYKSNLSRRISYVRRAAHDKATNLFNKLAFSETPRSTFDYLREEVDDKLLDLNPELAEKLMVAFKSVSSENPEEWSHALTTCRRLIEGIADELFPPTQETNNGRKLGQAQYINRLWVFMDKAIESESNRKLAKAHIDLLGSYLENIHKLTNKGVHAALRKLEAVKTVFHTYLMLADILDYLKPGEAKLEKPLNIHVATLDELESFLGVSRAVAKEIVKLRVKHSTLTPKALGQIPGIGSKIVAKAEDLFSFEPAK